MKFLSALPEPCRALVRDLPQLANRFDLLLGTIKQLQGIANCYFKEKTGMECDNKSLTPLKTV
ncbi:hypothetical protein QA644_34925 (plasmid) [Rhizobium sp. CC1099]|uniref:hypothetical protein n=1 Tax=Rhizobium sp. CC1099 TaxID=3039160 RepID=UPI0024B14E28|nr:hypothetical protein [Rhizobium sp. CC1099]WFU92081.1 hypothetical protein QA644_34925 [Rhizobium sp. CC1099]